MLLTGRKSVFGIAVAMILVIAAPLHAETEFFLFETNKRKAQEVIALIKSGAARDPFFDVVSDIQPGIFE